MKNKGITLVALVVTIVVLLILAGVSINLVLGENGLITQAKEAKEQTKAAEANEKESMDSVTNFIVEATTNLPQRKETKPYMPSSEFSVLEGTNLDNGLVIQDVDGNQYVWVEVPMTNIVYPTAGLNITEFNDDAYIKIENDLHTYTMTYRKGKNETETTYQDIWHKDPDNPTDWYTEKEYNDVKQKMLKSVYQNGGFWVGRYEAGIENFRTQAGAATIIPQSKQNLYPYNYITRTQAKKLAEMVEYGSGENKHTGSLMFGVQWDLITKFIETKRITEDAEIISELNINSKEFGNYNNNLWNTTSTSAKYSIDNGKSFWKCPYKKNNNSGVLLTTGSNGDFELMNIYDLSGNVWEWTLEYTGDQYGFCARRGGACDNSGTEQPLSSRNAHNTGHYYGTVGFRISIY